MHRLLFVFILLGAVCVLRAQPSDSSFREAVAAIQNDDLLSFKSLIEAEPALAKAHDPRSRATLLHIAASHGADDMCRYLLRKGADVNARDSVGGTALEAAVFQDRMSVVKVLIEGGADVHLGRVRDNAFFLSLSSRDTALVHYLLDHGCSATQPDGRGMSPIYLAAGFGTLTTIRILLENGADICGGHPDSCQTAWWAAMDSSIEKMEFIRIQGGNINFSAGPGSTVLSQALQFRNWNLAKYLVLHGARVTVANDPLPPMCRIARACDDTDVAAFFMKRGASINAVGAESGWSALMFAIDNKNETLALWLIAHGAETAYANREGETALALAQRGGPQSVVAAILAKGR